jgi:peptidoglycan/xylan/chitin deacetylase (PgdA/CDA1 family)
VHTATPPVSVVVPAHDAEATLAEALDSLLAQTYEEWEAVVVDDGSADATASIAGGYAARDPRFRVISRDRGGASAARNTGIDAAKGEWLLFLDADDWLLPQMLERLVEIVGADTRVDAAFGLATRVDAEGEPVVSEFGGRDNLFRLAGRTCPFAIHGGIVRRALVERVGGFDVTLETCEDWDLWQRVIRAGARIAHVDEVLAGYRLRPESLSVDARRLLRDGLEVIRRVHAPDPRVGDPDPAYANGLPAADAPAASLGLVGWTAGLALGNGDDPVQLLDLVEFGGNHIIDPGAIATGVCLATPIARTRGVAAWLELWPQLEGWLAAFANALEKRLQSPGLATRMLCALEREVLSRTEATESTVIGRTYVLPLELTQEIRDLPRFDAVERLRCVVRLGGTMVGSVEAPVCDGVVSPRVLADRIVAELAWSILGLLHAHAPATAGSSGSGDGRWEYFLRQLWGYEWPEADFYDAARETGRAELRTADRATVVAEVALPLPDLRTRRRHLRVIPTVAGVPLGIVRVRARRGVVRAQALRAAITAGAAFELCRIALREGLLGRPLDPEAPLRARLASAARRRGADAPAGPHSPAAVVLERRTPWEIGTSVSRRASFPVGTLDDVVAAAETASERIRAPNEAPAAVVYEPEAFEAGPPGPGERRAPLALRAFRRFALRETTLRLPILMYHRVTEDGGAATARYRVSPAAFAEQLEWLRSNGYRTVTILDWYRALAARAPLRGRCIALTFDDGYRDFLTDAWPLLRRQRFSATVLLVTDAVGGTNRWDEVYGDEAELLAWDEILHLQGSGVEFGAHSATHRPLTTLPVNEVVQEAARSRATMQRRLGRTSRVFAYPHGDADDVVRHLVGAVGFVAALSAWGGPASLDDPPLSLPRIEVAGSDSVEDLAAKLWYGDSG